MKDKSVYDTAKQGLIFATAIGTILTRHITCIEGTPRCKPEPDETDKTAMVQPPPKHCTLYMDVMQLYMKFDFGPVTNL